MKHGEESFACCSAGHRHDRSDCIAVLILGRWSLQQKDLDSFETTVTLGVAVLPRGRFSPSLRSIPEDNAVPVVFAAGHGRIVDQVIA